MKRVVCAEMAEVGRFFDACLWKFGEETDEWKVRVCVRG